MELKLYQADDDLISGVVSVNTIKADVDKLQFKDRVSQSPSQRVTQEPLSTSPKISELTGIILKSKTNLDCTDWDHWK